MKMILLVIAVALAAVVSVQLASSAPATKATIPGRVAALEAKVKKLTSRVNVLQARAACLSAQGLSQYGNPGAGSGYVYTNDGGTTLGLTTGIDFPASGTTPTFYAAAVNSACVTSSARASFARASS